MANFPIYDPWNFNLTQFVMEHAREGLYLLDVQLGSTCNANCPRCDSSCVDLSEPADLNIKVICSLAEHITFALAELRLKSWSYDIPNRMTGFVCGLGEPTAGCNLTKLKELVTATKDCNALWSIFNNGLYWDDELDTFLRAGNLAIMVQCNSNNHETVAEMMGISKQQAQQHLENRKHFWEMAEGLKYRSHNLRAGCTNVAASIVPEIGNYAELADILDECVWSNVFPLIGELEKAGNAKGEYHDKHALSTEELQDVLQYMKTSYGVKYETPICPATIGAIHVNNHNIVTVDEFTGLSCGWFGMGDPKVHEIGSILEMSYEEIVHAILSYRESRIPAVRDAIKDYPEMVFGGCGGNARKLLADYVALYD